MLKILGLRAFSGRRRILKLGWTFKSSPCAVLSRILRIIMIQFTCVKAKATQLPLIHSNFPLLKPTKSRGIFVWNSGKTGKERQRENFWERKLCSLGKGIVKRFEKFWSQIYVIEDLYKEIMKFISRHHLIFSWEV